MSFLGGIFGLIGARRAEKREDRAIAAANAYNDPSAIRARAEKAGVNPLLFMGPGVGLQTAVGGSNFMGSAIADFGQMLGGLVTQRGLAKEDRKNQAIQRKAKNEQKLTRMALNPKVDGIYAARAAAPSRAAALGLVRPNSGSTVPVLPSTGSDLPFQRGGMIGAISGATITPDELAASPAASDLSKAVPKAPIFWDGFWQTPHPDFPDATLVEDYLGDEGPPSFLANTQSGMKKLGYGFAQTPLGMKIKGWANGSYIAATRQAATAKYTKRKYGTDFSGFVLGPYGTLIRKGN